MHVCATPVHLRVDGTRVRSYLEAPADRPLDEGELLQLLRGPTQQAGGAQSHPAGKHPLNGSGPAAPVVERAASSAPTEEKGGRGGCQHPFPRRSLFAEVRRHASRTQSSEPAVRPLSILDQNRSREGGISYWFYQQSEACCGCLLQLMSCHHPLNSAYVVQARTRARTASTGAFSGH